MKKKNYPYTEIILNLLLMSASAGLYGFAGFFSIVLISKYLNVLIGNSKTWSVDITDVALSLLGFLMIFLIKFLKNVQKYQSDKSENNNERISI